MKLSMSPIVFIFWIGVWVQIIIPMAESKEEDKSILSRVSDIEGFIQKQQNQIVGLTRTVEMQSSEITELKRKLSVLGKNVDHTQNTVLNIQKILHRTKKSFPDSNEDLSVNHKSITGLSDDRPMVEEYRKERLLLPNTNNGQMVAFYAYMNQNELFGFHKVLVFNVVETNMGNSYTNHTGLFVAPVSGLYAFSCSLSPHHLSRGVVYIMLNDRIVATMFVDSDSSNWDVSSSSATVVLSLQQGDDVYLRSASQSEYKDQMGSVEGSYLAKSSFAGWLVSSF